MTTTRAWKPLRILGGTFLMALFVLVCLAVLVRFAGGWGVPYFGFTNERGSHCVNQLTGYVCTPLNLADVEYYADLDLPATTQVLSGTYTSTHDFRLEAMLRIPAGTAPAVLKTLNTAFGRCLPDHPSPIDTTGLKGVCVLANDDAVVASGEPASRLYSIGTGTRPDGSRIVGLMIRSR